MSVTRPDSGDSSGSVALGRPLSASLPPALGHYRDHHGNVAFFERGTLRIDLDLEVDDSPTLAAPLGWRDRDGEPLWDLWVCGRAWFAAVIAEITAPLRGPVPAPTAEGPPAPAVAEGVAMATRAVQPLADGAEKERVVPARPPVVVPDAPAGPEQRKARFTKEEAALLDRARGERSRGDFVRAVAADAARRAVPCPRISRARGKRDVTVNFRCAEIDAEAIDRARGSASVEAYIAAVTLRASI